MNRPIAGLALGTMLAISQPANAASSMSKPYIVNGTCDSSSHTAEGALGDDLTSRQSRFYCDTAVIAFFDDYDGHTLIQFAQKESHHGPILGFSGKIENNGIMMPVDHIYLTVGRPTTVSDGWCKLFYKNHRVSDIVCGMKIDETGRRTTAIVSFNTH